MTNEVKETAAEVAALIPRFSWELMDEEQRDALMQNVVLPRYMKTTSDGIQMGPTFWGELVGASAGAVRLRVQRLKQSQKTDDGARTIASGTEIRQNQIVRKMARDNPELVASAVAAASPEAQRKMARAIVTSDTAADSLVAAVSPREPKPRQGRPTWRRLSDATFALWEVGQELMDKVPADEERVRMISSAEKAQRLAAGISLLLNTGEMDEAFRDLLAEVEVEA